MTDSENVRALRRVREEIAKTGRYKSLNGHDSAYFMQGLDFALEALSATQEVSGKCQHTWSDSTRHCDKTRREHEILGDGYLDHSFQPAPEGGDREH